MMDGTTNCALLWASAVLKCMGKGDGEMERRQRDEIEGTRGDI